MMHLFRFALTFIVLGSATIPGFSQPAYPYLRSGDKLYDEGRYSDTETQYRKALELNPEAGTSYNLANSMFLQERIPEAVEEYQKAIKTAEKPETKSKAYYNMGNAYFENKEYQQSINAYKESLKINPADEEAKKNLMLAMRQLRQEQEQQEKKENKQEQQEQEQQEQDQQEQEQQNKEEQQQQQQQQQKEENKKEEVSKEEAKEILKAIEREDQRVQEKLKKTQGKTTPPVKDW